MQEGARAAICRTLEELSSPDEKTGRFVLLTAPRAGFGKTHLLQHLEDQESRILLLPLEFDFERSVSWQGAFDQVLHHCHDAGTATTGITILSASNRELFAALCVELIQRGLVECEDREREKTIESLQTRAVRIFDLSDDSSTMGQWFLRNFEGLLPSLSEIASNWCGFKATVAAEWLRVLCAYEQGQKDAPSARWQSLVWGVGQISQAMKGGFQDGVQVLSITSEGEQLSAKMRLFEFLSLLSAVRTPVIAVDHLDVLFRDVTSSLRLADVLTQLSANVPRSLVILSINEDVWNSGFRHHLPSALLDRMTGNTIRLQGVTLGGADQLVRARLEQTQFTPVQVGSFLAHANLARLINDAAAPVSPRAVLRHCSAKWKTFDADQKKPEVESPSLFPAGEPKLAPAPKLSSATNGLKPLEPLMPKRSVPEATVSVPQPNRVQAAFAERLRSQADAFAPDPVRIAALLRIAGEQFPMVHYEEEPVPSGNGAPPALVGIWKTGESEVLFGLRPYGETGYWKSLVQHVSNRAHGISKLAVFDNNERQHIDAIAGTRANDPDVDFVELDHFAVQRLSAASDLLDDAEKGVLEVPVPEAMAGLLDELDFFWKRVTRLPKKVQSS